MVIRNKDGSIYQVQQPNPIMQKQIIWEDDIVVHNFKITKETPLMQTPQVKEEVVTVNNIVEQPKTNNKIKMASMNCLPAEVKMIVDQLYGETKKQIKYKNPFKFEGIVTLSEDLKFEFWTNVNIGPMSIIYYKDWWKVVETREDSDGYMVSCMVSDVQPDFT